MSNQALTIVFSTRTDNPEFIKHLESSCGVEGAEILQYVNKGKYSLTEVYNRAVREAKNNIIVFSHDDVIFKSSDGWGQKVLDHFENSGYCILGKAGTTGLTASGRWWDRFHLMVGRVWHQQTDPMTGRICKWESIYSGNFGDKIIETILVDGLFFAVNREKIKKGFDETFTGFHFYDIDFSFSNHLEGVKVGVIFDIEITHKSIGMTNQEWESNRVRFVNKWKDILPYDIIPQPICEEFDMEFTEDPKVAVIALTKDNSDHPPCHVNSILQKTKYSNYKIYIGRLGSGDAASCGAQYEQENIGRIITIRQCGNNPAKANNLIVRDHIDKDTDLLLFCHDDIQLLNDAVSRCIRIYLDNKNNAGTIGIRLHFPDGSIQHAGISLYVDGDNQFRFSHAGHKSYYSYSPGVRENVTGTTDAFMMVHRDLFLSLGGFTECYEGTFHDIELNLKAIMSGKVNYFSGDAVAYHHESEKEDAHSSEPEKYARDFHRFFDFIKRNIHNHNVIQHIQFLNSR